MTGWSNWSGRSRSEHAEVRFARSIDEIAATVAQATQAGRTVRTAGSGHSHYPLVPTDDVIIDISGVSGVIGVDTDALQPFSVRLDSLDVRFEEDAGGAQFGAARDFRAGTTVTPEPGAPAQERELAVNSPLQFGNSYVYLLGNGYAPVITVRDAQGTVLYQQATPFLPQDGVACW